MKGLVQCQAVRYSSDVLHVLMWLLLDGVTSDTLKLHQEGQ